MNYLTETNTLYLYPSGFRKNHSRYTSRSHFTGKIMTKFDSVIFTGLILVNLQKAVDTKIHEILLRKAISLGFSNQ